MKVSSPNLRDVPRGATKSCASISTAWPSRRPASSSTCGRPGGPATWSTASSTRSRRCRASRSEAGPDETRLSLADPRQCKAALGAIARVLKGWQEEAEAGSEKRTWRWLIEGDIDEAGYDHNGEQASLWCFVRLTLERGGFGEQEKGEDIDLDGFGLEIPPAAGNVTVRTDAGCGLTRIRPA